MKTGLAEWLGFAFWAGFTVWFSLPVAAEEPVEPRRSSHNLFGMTGLIDMPSADMQPDGHLTVTAGYFGGFLRNTVSAQVLPGVEAAFRYSILEELNDPLAFQTTLFDRSFDVKVRLIQETNYWPSVAVGLQDFLGTGVYSSEYVAATKGFDAEEFGSFRITGGVGWGRFADSGGVKNPFSFSDRFAVRDGDIGTGGTVSAGDFFRGPDLGFFGGVAWQTPIDELTAKIEYSPDRYNRERQFGTFDQKSRINVGVEYRATDEIEIGAYYMYGSEVGVRVSISGNPFRPLNNLDLEPGPLPVTARERPDDAPQIAALGEVLGLISGDERPAQFSDPRLTSVIVHTRLGSVRWAEAVLHAEAGEKCPPDLAAAIDAEMGVVDVVTFSRADGSVLCTVAVRPAGQHAIRMTSRVHANYPTDWYEQPEQRDQLMEIVGEAIAEENLGLLGIEIAPRRVEVYVENTRYLSEPRAIGRTARALTRTLPASVEIFEITPVERSIPVATVVLQRSQIEEQVERPDATARSWATARIKDAEPVPWSTLTTGTETYPRYSWNIRPATPTSLFDPDQPFRIDLAAVASGGIEFLPGLTINASISKRLAGDLDEIERGPGSRVENLVRSEIAQYLREGDPALTRLSIDYVTKLSSAFYGRVSAGLLERMYGGVSAELLWKPAQRDWGVGLDINYVKQRGFNTLFDFREYDVLTGHASFYWDTDFQDLSIQIDAGRYLAGDWGGTFAMKRRFANGWEFGGFFTLTTIPFDEFGEGSFDKGLFLTIPFNWVLPYESQTQYSTILKPLTRDGGQRLFVSNPLYPMVEDHDTGGYRRTWEDFWE